MVTRCAGTRDADDQWRFHSDNHSVAAWRDLCVEMEKAAALAEQFGVDLGIEPELANVVSSANLAQKLMNDVPSERLRIVLDPANLFEVERAEQRKAIVADAVALLGGRISMAHAKDRDAGGAFVAAGTGVIDFAHFVECLRDVKFDGPMVTHGLSESEAPMVAKFLHSVFTT